jgi:hypothetical protein
MARRVILDIGVLSAIERGELDVDAALGADDACIATITAMELLVRAGRADDAHIAMPGHCGLHRDIRQKESRGA